MSVSGHFVQIGVACIIAIAPEWRNWQTRQTQNLVAFIGRVGSTPSSGTIEKPRVIFGMAPRSQNREKQTGLAYWMRRVRSQAKHCVRQPDPRNVHGLRVALRRCRAMADGLSELDGLPEWKAMDGAARKVLKGFNELRDVQVMRGWMEILASPDDPIRAIRAAFITRLVEREKAATEAACTALKKFDSAKWKRWTGILPARVRRIPPEGLVFQHLALLRWEEATRLHREALRRRSRSAWHELRLGVKRFRYCVENFLPSRIEAWGPQLKHMQDLLGEMHDLDVLSAEWRKLGFVFPASARRAWMQRIAEERQKRVREYSALTRAKSSAWQEWRAGLPTGKQLETAAIAWFRAWAGFRDDQWQLRRHLVALAMQLFDGCAAAGVNGVFSEARCRRILYAAALTQNTGRSKSEKGHHKLSYRLIRKMQAPVGWTPGDMLWTALVARYHRGASPGENQRGFRELPAAERKSVMWLAAVLRLADGLVACRPGPVGSVRVESSGGIHVWASGLPSDADSQDFLARKKLLLEEISHRPVLLHPLPLRKAVA